jgi:hypothetical protein
MNIPDEMRYAAQRITDLAEEATSGHWLPTANRSVVAPARRVIASVLAGEAWPTMADAEHIAAWNPEIAVLVAHWLDVATERWEADPLAVDMDECDEIYQPAIALARAINGGVS